MFSFFKSKNSAKPIEKSAAGGGWRRVVSTIGNMWQRNLTLSDEDKLTFHAVFSCVTLIASDISKLGLQLYQRDKSGVWKEANGHKWSKLIEQPNDYQTRPQFLEAWALSKQARGNAYIYKEKVGNGFKLHVLHPDRVIPLISENGTVYYQVSQNKLARVGESGSVILDADEIIHDRFNCLYHPLIGLSPLHAAGATVSQGHQIQKNSAMFFGNKSIPGGILTAPGAISDTTAGRLKESWQANYSDDGQGKVAVLGDGLTFENIALTASDSQLIEQLKWTTEVVCSVFHVPPHKIGFGAPPSYNNIQALNQDYYSQCLQKLIVDMQKLLNQGFGLGDDLCFRFDLDSLLMMDSKTLIEVLEKGVKSALMMPNEGRKRLNLPPIVGGDVAYLQQQNFSLEALAKRDSKDDPFEGSKKPPNNTQNDNQDDEQKELLAYFEKGLTSNE